MTEISNEVQVTPYEWSGLRNRRITLVVAILLFFPGSCVAMAMVDSGLTTLIPLVFLLVTLERIRHRPCPRCARGFSASHHFPWIAPLASRCRSCGLPDFTPSSLEAPPIVEAPPAGSKSSLSPEERERRRLRRRRMRVGLAFAIPLVYLTMCRLPEGVLVTTPRNHAVRVLGVTHNFWHGGGESGSAVLLTYYLPRPEAQVTTDELLALMLPAVRQTGDSTVRLQSIRGDWWARGLGIRVMYTHTYRLQSDGTWSKL